MTETFDPHGFDGSVADFAVGDIVVQVEIIEVRITESPADFEVRIRPVRGTGETWVSSSQVANVRDAG